MSAGLRPTAILLRPLEHVQQGCAEIPLQLCSDLNALQQILCCPVPGMYSVTASPAEQLLAQVKGSF